jgi:hypothetical protein
MKYKLFNESDILNEAFRKKVIEEIKGAENISRKKESLKRNEVYNGNSKKWVVDALQLEGLEPDTINRMANRASNIRIMGKVTDKIAKCYTGGVDRTAEDEKSQKAITALADLTNINTVLDKADKISLYDRNCLVSVLPKICSYSEDGRPLFKIKVTAMQSFTFDVIPDALNKTEAKCIVLTDFVERNLGTQMYLLPGQDGHERQRNITPDYSQGDGVEQTIANSPEDKGMECRTFIWWTENYHFTTDANGKILKPTNPTDMDGVNPIGMLPFVTITQDQADSYWARGGEQLIDGDILINKMITDRNMIAYVQGWGQLVIAGKELPEVLKGGPDKALLFSKKQNDDSDVQVFFATANPDLASWDRSIEQHLGFYLSTNNLSTRNVSGKLDVNSSASGIAILIEQSESMDDIKDKQRIFQDQEPYIWEIIKRWQALYFSLDLLDDDFKEVGTFEDSKVSLKFYAQKPVITEGEQVDILTKRKELGIDTIEDLIKRDNPDLTEEQVKEKMTRVLEERAKYPDFFVSQRSYFGRPGSGGGQFNQGNQQNNNQQNDSNNQDNNQDNNQEKNNLNKNDVNQG